MREPTRTPVTLNELCAGLIWPRLLRCFAHSLQPARLALCFLLFALLMLVGTLLDWVRALGVRIFGSGEGEATAPVFATLTQEWALAFNGFVVGLLTLDFSRCWGALDAGLRAAPAWLLGEHWLFAVTLAALTLPLWALIGGAVCRMAACDTAMGVHVSMRDALRFGATRWRHFLWALVAPVVLLATLAAVMWVLGLLLLRLPVLDVVGGAIYGLLLLLGLIAALVGVVFVFAQALLMPAVAADGADAIDACQRAAAYALGRPGRFAAYALVLIVSGTLAYAALAYGVGLAINITAVWTGAALRDPPLTYAVSPLFGVFGERPEVAGTASLAAGLIGMWERALVAVLAAFVLSFYFTGSTTLYLLMRRVNDEQDVEEIWTPAPTTGAAS